MAMRWGTDPWGTASWGDIATGLGWGLQTWGTSPWGGGASPRRFITRPSVGLATDLRFNVKEKKPYSTVRVNYPYKLR